jgi:hypothetical protein
MGERAFFVHGFAKSDRDKIRDNELAALKKLAGERCSITTTRRSRKQSWRAC